MSAKGRLVPESNLLKVVMDTKVDKGNLIYLYCVTKEKPRRSNLEEMGIKICPIYFQGTYAIVNKVSANEFGEDNLKKNLADLKWIEEKAQQHEKVVEAVMKNGCIIPFKFATLFNTEDNLKAMLEEHAQDFKEKLKNLEGKEEWGVKIYCDIERLKGTVIHEESGILKIEKEINSSSSGKAYFLKKKKEELMKEAVNKRINEYGQESFELFKILSYEARINRLLPREVTEKEDDMILNSAFLVDKDKVSEFIHAVDDLKTRYNDKGLNFDCTGPWPPYNFCDIPRERLQNG